MGAAVRAQNLVGATARCQDSEWSISQFHNSARLLPTRDSVDSVETLRKPHQNCKNG